MAEFIREHTIIEALDTIKNNLSMMVMMIMASDKIIDALREKLNEED